MSQVDCDSSSLSEKLMSVSEALTTLEGNVVPLYESETVNLSDGLGRILAADILSTVDVPPFSNSAMDGYALNVSEFDRSHNKVMDVSQIIPAGVVGDMLKEGTVARIFTGAPIPRGVDAVVMQELCRADEAGHSVFINDNVGVGQNIRAAGEDIAKNGCVLASGDLLQPQELGLLASIGCSTVEVIKKLRVAVFFTGDELKQPEDELEVGQIYNSNQFTLIGLLERLGCDVINLGIVKDDLPSTIRALSDAASKADLVLTSGGVSVGEEDHVKAAVRALGELELWRIAVKPGKPLAFGKINNTPFLGLPGNPVSVFVTACIFARPFIKAMQGSGFNRAKGIMVQADFSLNKVGYREEYLRVKLVHDKVDGAVLRLFPHQGSGILTSASWATGLAIAKQGRQIQSGDLVEYIPFSFLNV